MSSKAFKSWKGRMGFTLRGVAGALGISRGTAHNYCAGKRCDIEEPVEIPKHILLACSAVEEGLPPIQ